MQGIQLQTISHITQFKKNIPISTAARRLAHGTFWNFTGTVLARSLSVIVSIVVARILGRVGFGEIGIIQSTLLNFSVFSSSALGLTATKYISELRRHDPERAGRIMALSEVMASSAGGVLALLLAASAGWFASSVLAAPHLERLLRIGALMILFSAITGALNGALTGFEAYRTLARVNFIAALLNVPLMMGGAWFGGLQGAVYGLVASSAIGCLITHRAVTLEARRDNVYFSLKNVWAELPVLRGYSFPALLSAILYGPVGWACSVMLVNQPDGYPQMAVFNATNQWFAMVLFLPLMVSQAMLPMLCEASGKGDRTGSKRILGLAARTNSAVVIPLIVLGSVASPWILALYGKGYTAFWLTFVVSLVAGGTYTLAAPWEGVLNAGDFQWTMFGLNFVWALVFLAVTPVVIGWGALGLVCARLVAFTAKAVLTVLCANRLIAKMGTESAQEWPAACEIRT